MDYSQLKNAITAVIKENGNEEITGQVLQDVLLAIIDSLGTGYQFIGIATAETQPGTPDARVFYLRYGDAATLDNFGIEVPAGLSIIKWDTAWSAELILTLTGKIDKVQDATMGNLPILTPEGGLEDSGKSPADFATKLQGQKADTAYQKPLTGIPASDIAEGVIPDISQFITKSVDDLLNYYLKSETYTKEEVQALIGAINQFHYEIYASLDEITDPASNVLYLIGPSGTGSDLYEEYVYANDTFTKIGDTSIDLSGYVTTTALNTALANYTTTAQLAVLLSKKADKEGYYQLFRAGLADNLYSPTSVSQKYLFGPTAEGSEVASGPAFLRAFKGNGVAWKQFLNPAGWKDSETAFTSGAKYINNGDGSFSIVVDEGGATATRVFSVMTGTYGSDYANRAVFIHPGCDKPLSGSTIQFHTGYGAYAGDSVKAAGTGMSYAGVQIFNGCPAGTYTFKPYFIDLTLAGLASLTAAQVREWIRDNVGVKPLYPRNTGTLLGAALKGFKSWKTANLLNPATKTARLFEYTYGEAVNKYTVQNLPNDAALYFTPDATGVEAAVTMSDTTHFSVSGQGTLAVKTSDGSAAYAGDVSAVWLVAYYDGAMDSYDNYKPFGQDVKTIDAGKIYYDNAGTKTKVWADGVMKAAGNAQDELRYNDLTKKWGAEVAVGSRAYAEGDENDSTVITDKTNTWYGLTTASTYDTLYYSEDGETFVALEDVLSPDLLVDNWSAQETVVSDYSDGNPTAVTPKVEIEYMEDAVEALKTYKDEAVLIEDQHDQVKAVLDALVSAEVLASYTLGDTPTPGTKVFPVTAVKYTG